MITIRAYIKNDSKIYQYCVLEKDTNLLKPLYTETTPMVIDGVEYIPVNGRVILPIEPDFEIANRAREIYVGVNDVLNDQRHLFGTIMNLKGWWG